jgi:Velvet factor
MYSAFPGINYRMSESEDCRRPGTYLNTGTSKVLATAMSNVFEVYSPKKFPGMLEPSALINKFAAQGVRLLIRHSDDGRQNGSGARSPSNQVMTEEDDDNSGNEFISVYGIWGE